MIRIAFAAVFCGWSATLFARDVDFGRDVRPILAANCYECHGPDVNHREADLRLDQFESAGDVHGAEDVIDRENPAASEFIARITSDDDSVRMPPPDSGKELTSAQIELLRKWIAAGAEFSVHWAFVPPQRPDVPTVRNQAWVRNPIDAFVLARFEKEGLAPSPRAEPATLLRRLSLDLIGLPPAISDLDRLESAGDFDTALDAEIDRLLESPHFGERWGRLWLDAARYADSDGFEKDKPRQVWMYRNWVIDALNDDKPYDQFLIEQIAGDLIPGASQDAIVATGFLRNSMINEEGGVDPEQFRMEAMFDRMDAIGKAMLGLTIQCTQCHDHKYDPLTQHDYYGMFAFINNCHEAQITAYTDEQRTQLALIHIEMERIQDQLREDHPDWQQRMAAWEESVREEPVAWTIVRPELDASGGQKHYLLDDGSILAQGYAPTKHVTEFTVEVDQPEITAFRLELLNDPNLPHGGPGRSIYGLCALSEFKAKAQPLDNLEQTIDLKFSEVTADVNPPEADLDTAFDDRSDKRRVTGPVAYANDGDELTAWGLDIGPGRSNVPRQAVFVLEEPLRGDKGFRITFELVQKHGGWNSDDNQNNNLGRFRFAVTSAPEAKADLIPRHVREVFAIPPEKREFWQMQSVFNVWRQTVPEWSDANDRIEELWKQHPRGTSQLVVLEREEPRVTHRLERGDFLKPAEAVKPGVPDVLNDLHPGYYTRLSPNRLDFAHWIANRGSPTTARAIVNRIWQAYFGTGIVATPEDLGTQGDPPTHPELLDWLAVELMDNGWRLKHIHRLIVESATYQQSSAADPELWARDPANKLLARGPRFRLDAELVRDLALAASGLLDERVGGPSAHPPAPEFLFQPPASYGPKTWHVDTGPERYRRGLYTFRFRSIPYPVLENFDAPNGDFACVRRNRSNTPLQALTTLNETLFVECAVALARRALVEGGESDADRIAFVVRTCVSRTPDEPEGRILASFLDQQRERFADDADAAQKLISAADVAQIEFPSDIAAEEEAAWTALARVVLNLDETVTKE